MRKEADDGGTAADTSVCQLTHNLTFDVGLMEKITILENGNNFNCNITEQPNLLAVGF